MGGYYTPGCLPSIMIHHTSPTHDDSSWTWYMVRYTIVRWIGAFADSLPNQIILYPVVELVALPPYVFPEHFKTKTQIYVMQTLSKFLRLNNLTISCAKTHNLTGQQD